MRSQNLKSPNLQIDYCSTFAASGAGAGGRVIGVGAVVDRSGGRAQRLFGRIPCRNLVTLKIENFKPASCPLCREGWPMTKPGSKGLNLML